MVNLLLCKPSQISCHILRHTEFEPISYALCSHPLTQPRGSDAVQWLKLAFSITKDVTESYL